MVTLLPMALSLGCLDPPPYRCERDTQCFLQGYPGTCDRASGTCVYPSADCRGILSIEGYVDGQGNCVPEPNDVVGPSSTSTGPEGAETSGTASATSFAEASGAPVTGSSSGEPGWSTTSLGETSSGGSSESGTGSSTGGGGCPQPIQDMTNYGTVGASSQLNGYPATRANDGDNTTSWFSGGGATAEYTWSSEADRCIDRIEVDDNSMHANTMFQTDYGFQQAVVRVLQDDTIVFEELVPLPGSPDGNYAVETGGAIGSEVVLVLGPTDGAFFGGFSELRVFGDP